MSAWCACQGYVYVACFNVENEYLAVSTRNPAAAVVAESGPEATPGMPPVVPVKRVLQDKASDSLDGASVVLGIHSGFKSRLRSFSGEGEEGETANQLCPKGFQRHH